MWLNDFLPHALPNARIMTFGYNSRVAGSSSGMGVARFAKDLLNRLRAARAIKAVCTSCIAQCANPVVVTDASKGTRTTHNLHLP